MDQMTTPVEPGDVLDMSPQAIDRRSRRRARALAQIQDDLVDLFEGLQRDHGFQHYRIGELRHPDTGLIVGSRFAGNEYTLMIVNAPGYPAGFGTIGARLTQAVIEREPDSVKTLGRIIIGLTECKGFQVHVDAGMSLLGLECDGDLFGYRTPVDADVDARIDAIHGPGAAAALDRAIADGTFSN